MVSGRTSWSASLAIELHCGPRFVARKASLSSSMARWFQACGLAIASALVCGEAMRSRCGGPAGRGMKQDLAVVTTTCAALCATDGATLMRRVFSSLE